MTAFFLLFFLPNFVVANCLVATIATTPVRARERQRLKVMRPPIHNPTKPPSNPEASRTNVSEETQCTWQPWLARTAPGPPQESLVRDETRTSLPAQTLPNPDAARPIVRRGQLRQSLGTNLESLVAQLALRCSALDHCATREAGPPPIF